MKRRFLAMLLSVAMVLTMLPVTAFAADSTPAAQALTQLAVRAIKATGADGKITLKVTATSDDADGNPVAVKDFYYRTSTDNSITAPTDGEEIKTSGDANVWTKYDVPFVVTDTVSQIAVIQVATVQEGTDNKLTAKGFGSTQAIADELGTLTVSVDDKNVITVKKGDTATTSNLKYYALAVDKLDAFNTAKADWASDTALTALASDLGLTEISVTEGTSASITKGESGKYIVVVETGTGSDNNTTVITSLGVTEKPVKFVKPFKLFLGEPTDTTTATDVIADIEEADSTYTVTVPVDTEKLTVSAAEGVTVTIDTTSGNVTESNKVVTLNATAADASADTHSFTVKVGATDSQVSYPITVARVKPSLKNADTDLIDTSARNGNEFTYSTNLENSVKSLTLSVPENALKLTLKSANVAHEEKNTTESVNNGLVYLEDGLNTITVTFSDNSTCTIKVTRTAAAPGVALYAGAKAEGDDLLADVTPAPANTYAVTVPSTTTQVTVGATAGTIASVSYVVGESGTPTTSSNKVVPVTSAGVNITVKFNDNAEDPTTFTIEVSQSAAFVNLTVAEGTGDKAGKVVVTAPEEVPAGLKVVVLSKDPAWTETTAKSKVDADIAADSASETAYNDGTMAIPAASESDQYVVVYNTDDSFVTHYGVLKVDKVDRGITVTDSTATNPANMITFDPAVHEYTVSVDQSVTGVKIEALPGNTRMSVSSNSTMSNGVVEKITAGGVSTVTVTYMDVASAKPYTIKLVWPIDTGDISPNKQKVTVETTVNESGEATVEPAEDAVLQAISTTSLANNDAVQITATSSPGTAEEDLAATTTVTLPASAAELLQDTGIDAKVVTDAGEVTIPSEAIKQTQPGTEDKPAAPVAIAVVVAKKDVAEPGEDGIVEAAKFEVTVKKADADGVMEATNITDLQKPITLVFKVLKTTIGEMKNPRLAHVKTEGGKTTYEKLTNAAPTESGDYYVFTEKTSHLSEFAVVAEEATTEPETTGLKITDISVTGAEDFDFVETTKSYDVTALPESKTVSVVITTDTGKYDGITVNDTPYGTEGVQVTLSNEGKATIEIKVNDTLEYTLNVSKDPTPVTEEISIALTDKDGNDIDFGFDPDETTPYTVETDATPVTVEVTGNVSITVNGESKASPVEVTPTETGVVVVVTSTDDPTKKYTITLKAKAEPPVTSDAPVSNKVSIGSKEYTVTFNEANGNGERISKETLPMESTDKVVTLTVAEGAIVTLDDGDPATAVTAGTFAVTVEDAGKHTITVTDSEGKNPYIINLTKEAAAVDENQPTIGDGETGTLEFDKTNEDGSKENTTPITVASTASSYKLNVAAGATVKVNGKDVPVPASGEVTIPLDGSGLFKIEIENKDGTKYIVNVEKQKAPGSLDIAQNGTVNIFAKVEISNIKTGKYYLVKIDVPATVARAASYSYLILDGNGYTSGTATIAPASGSKILVEEYDSMADLAEFNSSLKTDSATWTVR